MMVLVGLIREFHPKPYDAFVVCKQLLHFTNDTFLEGICEFEVLARYDDFVNAHVFLLSDFCVRGRRVEIFAAPCINSF